MATYRIVRFFQRDGIPSRTIKTGLTLEQAQVHCQNSETSSSTAKLPNQRNITQAYGPWFDGYDEEK